MAQFETIATVGGQGEVRIAGVPFATGTEVEVTISPKRRSAEEFATAWRRVCDEMRARSDASQLTDDDIRAEIAEYRTGK